MPRTLSPNYSKKQESDRNNRSWDIGAGTGKLTKVLLKRGATVTAVEPNEEMRKYGAQIRRGEKVTWLEGTGEHTGVTSSYFRLATFGSSFNVVDRQAALKEVDRVVVPKGWFACMWNHRDLTDETQALWKRRSRR